MVFSSSSLPLRFTMSTAVMIMPGVQKPHCRPWFSRNASCMGWSVSPFARLSMVRTSAPSAVSTSSVQDFTALPLTCTTQAPHCEVSQPTWVPVSRRFSRRNCTRRVRGSTSAVTGLPFTVSFTAGIELLPRFGLKSLVFALAGDPGDAHGRNRGVFASFRRLEQEQVLSPCPIGSRVPAGAALPQSLLAGRDRGGEFGEEIIRHFLGGARDEPLAELGELAADLGLDIVGEQRAAVLGLQRDDGAAFGEARDAALALAGNLVAVGRIEVGEMHLTFPLRLDGPDLGDRNRLEFGVGGLVELLATGDAGLQHLGVIELGPDRLARRIELNLSVHRHGHCVYSLFQGIHSAGGRNRCLMRSGLAGKGEIPLIGARNGVLRPRRA